MPNIVFEHLKEHIDLISLRENKLNVNKLTEFEKFSLTFSSCNPFPSVPSVVTGDKK